MSRLDNNISVEVQSLLLSVCEEGVSQEQLTQLELALPNEPTARLLLDCMQLDVDLRTIVRGQRALERSLESIGIVSVSSARPSAPEPCFGAEHSPFPAFLPTILPSTLGYSSGWPLAYLIATVITGLWLLSFWLMPVSQPEQVARQSDSLPSPLSPLRFVVGRITGLVDCRWGEKVAGGGWRVLGNPNQKSEIRNHQSLVSLGDKFLLSSGLLEITYDTGAKVILQGPVTYEAESNGGYLAVGKLTGKLEKRNDEARMTNDEGLQNSSFVIRTPTATVTDLGTEFGVEVNEQGVTTSHVFRGSVQLQAAFAGGATDSTARVLHENQSARVERGSGNEGGGQPAIVLVSSVKSADFVRTIPRRPARRVLLSDDFHDNTLDSRKWFTNTSIPLAYEIPPSVVARNGRVELTNQAYLITLDQFNTPGRDNIEITGLWTFARMDRGLDFLIVTTRCTGDAAGYLNGTTSDGVRFLLLSLTGKADISVEHVAGWGIANLVQTGKVIVHEGDTFQFRVVDCGESGLSITVTQVGNPSNTTSATAILTAWPNTHNHVVIHNICAPSGKNVAYLDDLSIVAIEKPAAKSGTDVVGGTSAPDRVSPELKQSPPGEKGAPDKQ